MLKSTATKATAAGALVLSGLGAGFALAVTGAADAASPAAYGRGQDRPAETPLTGATADKVRAAVLAKYPGATVERLETDSDGVYEAHVTNEAGERLRVQVGKDFAVTGTQTGREHGRHGGPEGRRGPGHGPGHDGDEAQQS